MKKCIGALFLAFVAGCMPAPATSNTPEGGSPMPPSIVDPYLKIQASLVRDSLDEVKANAGNIATAATPLGAPAFKIGTAAVQLSATTELPEARASFGTLSDAIIAYMDGLHLTPPAGVHIAQCETTRKQWLQEGESISNPYDGSSAPACGSVR
jgi:membrane fusion protein, copper/silver efflux system